MDLTDFWEVESAAILNYHIGNSPEPRAISTLQKAGIMDYSHIARQVRITIFLYQQKENISLMFIYQFYMIVDKNIFHSDICTQRLETWNYEK